MKLPKLRLGGLEVPNPIIQGGMAVRISTHKLAAAVANEGGIGIIAGTAMSVAELKDEIAAAKRIIKGKGALGVNVLFAVSEFAQLVKGAMESGIDLLISGAGFSRDMFSWGKNYGVPVVPVVSTARLAKLAEKLGAAAVIVEGVEAGGHLGTDRSIKEIFPEVLRAVKIPVIPAGGIMNGTDIYDFIKKGAQGVQMGTRFAASVESGAADELKQAYLEAKAEDSILIHSPVGLPGRAIINSFSQRIYNSQKLKINGCTSCLKHCSKRFCVRQALENAQVGKLTEGLVFAGQRVSEIKDILPVSRIFKNLRQEFSEAAETTN